MKDDLSSVKVKVHPSEKKIKKVLDFVHTLKEYFDILGKNGLLINSLAES